MNPSHRIPSSKIPNTLLGIGLAVGLGWATLNLRSQTTPTPNAAPPDAPGKNLAGEITTLRTEIEHLKGLVPDQAHAMEDVGYHFANLWFAAEKRNWPLVPTAADWPR